MESGGGYYLDRSETIQLGNESFSVPIELYDLKDLSFILSVDNWNELLSEVERFGLSKYLPDMDQESFSKTLIELFSAKNFHFGSPVVGFLGKLKGGEFEPGVSVYRRGLNSFCKRKHYHEIRKYHDSMVSEFFWMKDAWEKCKGYGVEERLRVLNIMRSRSDLGDENDGDLGLEMNSENRHFLNRKIRLGSENQKGRYDIGKKGYELSVRRESNELCRRTVARGGLSKAERKQQFLKRYDELIDEGYAQLPDLSGRRKLSNEVTIASYARDPRDNLKNSKYSTNLQSQGPAHVSSKKQKKQESIGTYKTKLDSDLAAMPYETLPTYNSTAHIYSDRMPKSLKEKKANRNFYQTETMDMKYLRGRARYDQIEETESDSSDEDEQLEYPNGVMGYHQYSTVRSVYDPLKAKKLGNSGEKPYNFAFGKSSIHEPVAEPYFKRRKQKSEMNAPAYLQNSNFLYKSEQLHNGHMSAISSRYQAQIVDSPDFETGHSKESYMPLLGCKTTSRKQVRKARDRYQDEPVYQQLNTNVKIDDRDRKKRKTGADTNLLTDVSDPIISGKGTLDNALEARSQKKPFTLITPTTHTGFSFSIIHLLSAIRKAMVTSDNSLENGKMPPHPHKNGNASASEYAGENQFPHFSVQEIANCVRLNPGDPCILETQEPLQDLIRGALKILSSKTAPLGAKGWRALVSYEKSNKGWSWVGPVSSGSSGSDAIEEETSPEAWGIPYKMLVSLVNAFANWLKSSQETLQQIGSLPAPPIIMLANLDEKERFKELRTQKNPNTINPSSDEQRAYFRKEEFLRYTIPDRAFSYTAADGKKSSVAPLTRGAGKPTSKARDHYMLKHDRPPYVTVRCVVRDAAARLPGSIGTRADVCTLLRDSQYIVEDITNTQINQVVSGALDRLHSEVDPCIYFDGDRKLWVYLHRDREEEDFEDDGTSSTKNWKKPKKDTTEHIDGIEDPSHLEPGFDLNSDV